MINITQVRAGGVDFSSSLTLIKDLTSPSCSGKQSSIEPSGPQERARAHTEGQSARGSSGSPYRGSCYRRPGARCAPRHLRRALWFAVGSVAVTWRGRGFGDDLLAPPGSAACLPAWRSRDAFRRVGTRQLSERAAAMCHVSHAQENLHLLFFFKRRKQIPGGHVCLFVRLGTKCDSAT